MAAPLLQTKLYIPPARPELVSRPRLIERLNAGLHRKLTLVSAPAGFGKTTLVSEWVANLQLGASGRVTPPTSVAWLSLDESDNDLIRFLTYFVAALQAAAQTMDADICKGAQSTLKASGLQSSQPSATEAILTTLVNEVAALSGRLVLVLDDYHLIHDACPASAPVHDALTFLLEHLPPATGSLGGIHLVLATREDPPLPLARLRAQGQLTELRAADLRFTPSEAAEFLNTAMCRGLSVEDIAALEDRTEGWIAGLQMAALALQGRSDSASFIRAFTGSHRFVLDYLVEDVLQRQPERVRSFLLQTCILDRLSGSLCDAVRFGDSESHDGTQSPRDSQEMLNTLERGNLFLVPLDDERRQYRYHRLFADVLQARLMEEQPGRVPILHLRASEWYERNGSPPDAVRHALAAGDFERAAALIELAWRAMDDSFQSATWLGWVRKVPQSLIRTRPVLCTQVAWALWLGGELEASEARLRDAERWLDPTGDRSARPEGSADGRVAPTTRPEQRQKMVVVDEEQFRTLPASIALVRAYNAQAQGDLPATVEHLQRALELTPEEDHLGRAKATVNLGFTRWASGDLEAARRAMADWISSMQKAGNIVFAIASAFALADIMVAQGRLREAVRTYQRAMQLASEQDEGVQRVTAHLYLGLAMLYHEMGDREAAAQLLLQAKELGEQSTLPDWPHRWCLARAHLKESKGDWEAALDLLDEAERLYVRNTLPDIRPIEALKARVYLKQGRLSQARTWARTRGLSVDDELCYLREFEHLTLARVLIAEYQGNRAERSILEAIGLLERLLKAAEEGARNGSTIEILVVQALAHQAQGNIPLALAPLERALTLAEPEGYLRTFVDEGPPMAALLREGAKRGIAPSYVGQLRAAFGEAEAFAKAAASTKAAGKRPASQPLIDPLTKRELQVVELLGTELSGPEIARKLGVSLTTIRTHTQHIYGKLGVNNRRAAVRRAEELGYL